MVKKAWKIEYDLFNSVKPEINKLPDWGDIFNFEKFNQELLKLFWLSFVPRSGAPEHLVVEAVQSVENMGKYVTESEKLLEDGFQAFEKNDLISQGAITYNIFYKDNRTCAQDNSMKGDRPEPVCCIIFYTFMIF